MKNFSKIVMGVMMLSLFIGFSTQAATGDIAGYLSGQKQSVNTLFDATYTKIYTEFTQTGLNIMRSVAYQSLVCLGAIKSDGLLFQLQNDKTAFKIAFNKDFIDLENQILGLEEKNRLQIQHGISLFDAGTTYVSETAKIKDAIDAKVKLYQGLVINFNSNYAGKNNDFLSTFVQYTTANQTLMNSITNKMTSVQKVTDAFAEVDIIVKNINAKITGLDDLIQKMEDSKAKGMNLLATTIQPLIDTNVKKYKRLQNIQEALLKQQAFVIGEYESDLNEYITNKLQNRYDRNAYNDLKSKVTSFQATFYTVNGTLNCSNILSATDASAGLLTKIASMKTTVGSGLAMIETNGVTTDFKDQMFSGFQALYIQQYKQRYKEYVTYLKGYLKTALRNLTASAVSTITTDITTTVDAVVQKVTNFSFNTPFKDKQYSPDIKTLQNTLTSLGFYSGSIDGIYSKLTKNAVYQFQLSKGLLKGYEKKPSTWGFFGPATRKAINNLIQ